MLTGQLGIDKNKKGERDRAPTLGGDRQETGQWSNPKTELVKTRLLRLQPEASDNHSHSRLPEFVP